MERAAAAPRSCLHLVLPGPGSELCLCWKPIGIIGFSRGSGSGANRPGGWPRLGSAKAGGGEGTTGPAQDFSFLILFLFLWLKADLQSSHSTAQFGPQAQGPGVQLPGSDPLASSVSLCHRRGRFLHLTGRKSGFHLMFLLYVLHFRVLGFNRCVCDQIKHCSIWWSSLSTALIASLKPHHSLTVFKPLTKCFPFSSLQK